MTTPVSKPVVVVDTTTTFDDQLLNRASWNLLLTLCGKGMIRLIMPDVVVLETVRHWKRQSGAMLTRVQSETKRLKTAFGIEAGDGPDASLLDVAKYEATLRSKLGQVGAEVPGLPAVSLATLLARDLKGRKPFSVTGKGFRDALNWETILELMADDLTFAPVYWISKNSEDFAEKDHLHPHLLEDLRPFETVTWVETLDVLVKMPEFEGLVKDLRRTEAELDSFVRPDAAPSPEAGRDLSVEEFVRSAVADAVQLLVGQNVETDNEYGSFGSPFELEIPSVIESAAIETVSADLESIEWQIYETFNETTMLLLVTVDAVLVIEGIVPKGETGDLAESVSIRDWDLNRHYSSVGFDCEAKLMFQVRVDEGVGVDYIELQSATVR